MTCACSCGEQQEVNLVYACSGAANTGMLADQVMRALIRDKVASGTCLAAVGADLSGFHQSARNATRNLVIDGCPVACGKKIFENKGLPYVHFVMTDFGAEKGKTAITGEIIEDVAAKVAALVKA